MTTSSKGRALIQSYEKCRLTAYKPTPNDVWTIGWGHTGRGVAEGRVITQVEADTFFEQDLHWCENAILTTITVDLTQPQFDALVCLVFNVGVTAFTASHLRQAINTRDHGATETNWLDWDHQAGRVITGLQRRRLAEWTLFSEGANASGS